PLAAVPPPLPWCEVRSESTGVPSAVAAPPTTSTASAAAPSRALRDGCRSSALGPDRRSPAAPTAARVARSRTGHTARAGEPGGGGAPRRAARHRDLRIGVAQRRAAELGRDQLRDQRDPRRAPG